MRTTTATMGIAAAVLLVSFLLPEHRLFVAAPPYSQAGQPVAEQTVPPATVAGGLPAASTSSLNDGESDADRRTRERMKALLPVVDFPEGTAFAEVLEYLRDQGRLSIDVNWPALALANVERTTDTGGITLRDVKIETALAVLLDRISSFAGGAGEVAYDITDGTVRISTRDNLDSRTVVRIYDCSDLIGRPLTRTQASAVSTLSRASADRANAGYPMFGPMGHMGASMPGPMPSTRPAQAVGGPGTMGPAGNEPATEPRQMARARDTGSSTNLAVVARTRVLCSLGSSIGETELAGSLADLRRQDSEDLLTLITTIVEPGTWEPEGGTLGAACEYDGLVVVRHTARAQQEIDELLAMMRRAQSARTAAAARMSGAAPQPSSEFAASRE